MSKQRLLCPFCKKSIIGSQPESFCSFKGTQAEELEKLMKNKGVMVHQRQMMTKKKKGRMRFLFVIINIVLIFLIAFMTWLFITVSCGTIPAFMR